jgi:hypothetical protein
MQFECDPDVQAAAEFMQRNIPASRLVNVAESVAALAPLLWGQYETEHVAALRLREHPIASCASQTRSASNG